MYTCWTIFHLNCNREVYCTRFNSSTWINRPKQVLGQHWIHFGKILKVSACSFLFSVFCTSRTKPLALRFICQPYTAKMKPFNGTLKRNGQTSLMEDNSKITSICFHWNYNFTISAVNRECQNKTLVKISHLYIIMPNNRAIWSFYVIIYQTLVWLYTDSKWWLEVFLWWECKEHINSYNNSVRSITITQ